MPLIEFIKQNWLACLIAVLTVAVALFIVVTVIVRLVKKRNLENLEKMITENPVTTEDEIAVTASADETKRDGDADLKWVREQSLENSTNEEIEVKKDEKKTTKKSETTKKTAKTTTKKSEQTKESTKKSATKTTAKTAPKKAVGKWVIREKGDGEFVSYLHANNGEIILTSEIYASAESAKRGITTIKKSIEADGFQLYCDKNRNYYFKLKNASNRFLCVGETYPTKASCTSAIESVKRFATSPIASDIEKELTIIKYVVPKDKEVDKKTTYTGKWAIVDVEDMFIAQLFASNGELLLSSEAYTTASSAKSAIETITTNGLAGNFIIDVDKKGRYFFKLRNAQKSTLCVGETYAEQARCESAIESVRRFLKTAKLAD
ncbi:MAG: YegP family protein [Clostridia bacterium]|nr:YegP family protein [Clostridia bacterium]